MGHLCCITVNPYKETSELSYERLPFHEQKVYGQLLSPGYLASGAMPDIPAAPMRASLAAASVNPSGP